MDIGAGPVATVEENHRPFRGSRRGRDHQRVRAPTQRTGTTTAVRGMRRPVPISPAAKAGASKPSGATTAGMARLTSAHTEGHDRRVRETRLPLAGPRCSPCRVVVGSPSLPLHPCLVVEESAVHRHTGLTEEFDDVGITSGDPGDVSLDRYLPAPGGDGRVHDDRSGVHTANGATGRPIPRAWASAGTLRCSRDGTHRQCREAAPRPVPGNGLSECPAACGAVRPSRSRVPCAVPTKRVRPRIRLPGPSHHPVARQAAHTARFSRAEPLCVTDARARRAFPLSRSAGCVPSMRGRCRFTDPTPEPERITSPAPWPPRAVLPNRVIDFVLPSDGGPQRSCSGEAHHPAGPTVMNG